MGSIFREHLMQYGEWTDNDQCTGWNNRHSSFQNTKPQNNVCMMFLRIALTIQWTKIGNLVRPTI